MPYSNPSARYAADIAIMLIALAIIEKDSQSVVREPHIAFVHSPKHWLESESSFTR